MFAVRSFLYNNILPSITQTMLKAWEKSGKKIVYWSLTSQFFVLTFLSRQFKFSVHSCILCCSVVLPPHPFAYFLIFGYLFQTLDNSTFFFTSPEGLSYRGSTIVPPFRRYTQFLQVFSSIGVIWPKLWVFEQIYYWVREESWLK